MRFRSHRPEICITGGLAVTDNVTVVGDVVVWVIDQVADPSSYHVVLDEIAVELFVTHSCAFRKG